MSHQFEPNLYEKSIYLRAKLVGKCIAKVAHLIQWRAEGGDTIMDIGCGIGDITKECFIPLLPVTYSRLVCSDLSPLMLEEAKHTLAGSKKVDFVQVDIGRPLSESKLAELGTFDHIFSSMCFTYVPNQWQAFRNVYDLLTPNGDTVITIQATTPPIEILFRMAEQEKWKNKLPNIRDIYVYSYRDDSQPDATIRQLMEGIGFHDISIQLEDSFDTFKNEESLRDFMKSFPYANEILSSDCSEEFFQEMIKIAISMNLLEDHLNGNPPLENNARKLIHIYGRK